MTTSRSLVLPEPLLSEIGYLVGSRCGAAAEAALIRDLASEAFDVMSLTSTDWRRVADLVETYSDLPLGLADACVVALAERLGCQEVATLDQRHFSVVCPRHTGHFTIVP